MDIDKLIDRLKKAQADGSWNTLADFAHKAAEALSTLQAELEAAQADREVRCVVLSDGGDYIPRQAVIDLLYYCADEACSAIVEHAEQLERICAHAGYVEREKSRAKNLRKERIDCMKCKFEHDGDCCNSGSPQYMCKCKPNVCHSTVPMTNADRIRAMSDEELLDFMIKTVGNAVLCKALGAEPKFFTLEWLQQPAKEE